MKYLFLFFYFTIIFSALARAEGVEVSQPFIQVVADGDKLVNIELGVLNLGEEENFQILVSPQENFIEVKEQELLLAKEGFDTLHISLNPIRKKYGVYVGEIKIINEENDLIVPVIMEVQTTYPVFDVSLENLASPSQPNSLLVDIAVYKLKGNSQDVNLSYFITRTNGEIIFQYQENLKVERQTNLKKSFSVPESGDYAFYVTASDDSGISVGTGAFLFSSDFSYSKKESNLFYIIAVIIIILIAAFLIFTHYWTRRIKINARTWRQKIIEAKRDNSSDARKAIRKLEYQLSLLESARSRGYIKENSYKEAKTKINFEISKLKKSLK